MLSCVGQSPFPVLKDLDYHNVSHKPEMLFGREYLYIAAILLPYLRWLQPSPQEK